MQMSSVALVLDSVPFSAVAFDLYVSLNITSQHKLRAASEYIVLWYLHVRDASGFLRPSRAFFENVSLFHFPSNGSPDKRVFSALYAIRVDKIMHLVHSAENTRCVSHTEYLIGQSCSWREYHPAPSGRWTLWSFLYMFCIVIGAIDYSYADKSWKVA